uniref:Uncharacterized protein n=1 Tax=Rhizophora mucronata TaxID=61149 RepID=A0A2P2ITW5_RHIMU
MKNALYISFLLTNKTKITKLIALWTSTPSLCMLLLIVFVALSVAEY